MTRSVEPLDFKEEDELCELNSGELLENLGNPSPENSPVLQHQCVRNFCQENCIRNEYMGGSSLVEAAAVESDSMREEDVPTVVAEAEDSRLSPAFQLDFEVHEKETDVGQVNHGPVTFSLEPGSKNFRGEISSPSKYQLNSCISDSPPSQEQGDMISANVESLSDHSSLSLASDSEDMLKNWTFGDMEMIDINTMVIMSPEYVILKDRPSAASLVIFSCNGVIIKGYPLNNEEGPYSYEWRVEDIVNIEYNWSQNFGLVTLKIQVLWKDEECCEDLQDTTDIKELRLGVSECDWVEKQQKINSLNVKYRAIWNAEPNCSMEVSDENLSHRRRYFPSFDETFEDVVYPKGDPDAVSICKRDVDLLQPETFVNDTIIDFYIKYLKNQIQCEEMHRFHFFNSFFFRKLADLDKDPSSIADGKAAFQRVRKWTRKVDIFGKDFIFIPVNFNLHWSLIVICHPSEVADYTDLDLDNSAKVPCILHMDSIRGSHAGLKNLVQSYLCEEWKERHKETSDEISSKFLNLRFVSLELPQQENSFDCGLFLLHYLELFLAEAPRDFNPFRISRASNFLYLNWFPPAEASLKRTLIQKLIFKLLENRSQEVGNEQNQSSESPVDDENNMGIEVFPGNMTQSQDSQGIEMTLLDRSSMRNCNESGIVLKELFDSGAAAGSLLGHLQSFEEPSSFYHISNATLPREQVDLETGEQFMCINPGESSFQPFAETTTPRGSFSFTETSWNLGISVQREEEGDDDSSETLTDDDSDNVNIIEDITLGNIGNDHQNETARETSSLSAQPEIFSEALGSNTDDHSVENEESFSPPHDEPLVVVPSSQDDIEEDETLKGHNFEMVEKTSEDTDGDDSHDEEQPAKRPRWLAPPNENGSGTRNLSMDLGS
ncbi:PREDICTED: probable ubiquitin-like-specific protease 2B isoform X2 [Tarenaya hassleriana]|uniref:probable ubiquitin-like-specific protease 2B isoform X2 n=1 Tax=Tarenaya hassleriana TaxID=28532 RepID=UPI00053C9F9F|nr:PREDICTED: probable ubiquitin-like-specific protease 2B isoform X2 [Tarenaya hassleriana]